MTIEDALFARLTRPLAPIPTGMAPDLVKMQPFSAMLFDVYGTLLISGAGEIGICRHAAPDMGNVQALLRRHGIDRRPDQIVGDLHQAVSRFHAVSRDQGIAHPEVDILQIWRQVLGVDDMARIRAVALEYELMVNPVYPMPGLDDLLPACRRGKIPMGIISNAQFYTIDILERFLKASLARQGFDPRLLFFSWQTGHAKPSTVMFEKAIKVLAKMRIPAGSVLYVGNDMRNDIWPARYVGFKTALFAGDRRSLRLRASDESCRNLSADLIVTDLRQLIAGIATFQS